VSNKDPFSLVYDVLWDMLETARFQELVKVGNRVKFSTASQYRDPELLASLSEDRPVVGIMHLGSTFGMERASNTSFITPQYQILLVTGDVRLDREFYPCLWEIVAATLSWWDYLRKLLYQGKTFIHMAELTTLSSMYVDPAKNKGIKGWVGRLTYEVQMGFSTAAIRPR